jgi:hypothetical protein
VIGEGGNCRYLTVTLQNVAVVTIVAGGQLPAVTSSLYRVVVLLAGITFPLFERWGYWPDW